MGQAQADVRRQQRVDELCAASIRALAGERDLHFRGQRLHRGRRRLPDFAPHLHPSPGADDFGSFRGAADGLAARLRLSDDALHRCLAPAGANATLSRALFSMLEQFRVEALAAERWPGVRRNLQHRFERWTDELVQSGLAEGASGLLLFALAQAARARVSAQPPDEQVQDLIEGMRARLARSIGADLAALRDARHDQARYAAHARAIAEAVARMLEQAGVAADGARIQVVGEVDERLVFGLQLERDEGDDGDPAADVAAFGRSRLPAGAAQGYRVFTTAYDREFRPATRVRAAELDEFRRRLDAGAARQGLNVARLARQLQAVLAVDTLDDWASAQEDGLIDGRRLAQLVASPAERRLYRQPRRVPQADCVFGLLLDCSGSMRQHSEAVALLADTLARALDLAGVASEILGFSTGAWNGGRAARDWQRAGRPAQPGRLNEIAHLVFKDADEPWRRARRAIAALLDPRLYREGLDGEALAWAATRLRARGERRRVLLVVSDGCPMDAATQLANGEHYLDQHLLEVVSSIETAGDIELAAIGVGLDLSPYYGRSRSVDLDVGLGPRLFQDVVALMA